MSTRTTEVTPRPAPRRVLEDASGRRLRRMRWFGRVVAALALLWLVVVILGGVGVGPATHLPFGGVLRPTKGPPPIPPTVHPRPPTPADLVPALPAPTAATAARARARAAAARANRTRAAKHTAHGHSSVAPGHSLTTRTRGHSSVAPGQTKRTATTVTTTPGHSGSAPGQTTTRPKRHATGQKP